MRSRASTLPVLNLGNSEFAQPCPVTVCSCEQADGQMPERTVNQFEFFNVLERYKLLEQKVTHERVIQLQAICKADAMQIFKKCGRTDQGGNASRLSQVFLCKYVLSHMLLQQLLHHLPTFP